jgi:oligopeptide transport system substrate-binding protein
MPEASADGKTLVFRLKKGVLFQDDPCFKETRGKGRELTAEDFVYSLKRIADPLLASTGWWALEGKIAGLNEWRESAQKAGVADYSKPVEGLQAIDRFTLQIKLRQRSEVFLYRLAMPFLSVVPREAVEYYGRGFGQHPVGTGPFKLEEYGGGARLVYSKNPTFRKEAYPSEGDPTDPQSGLLADAGAMLPLSNRVVVQLYSEQQALWQAFVDGKVELAPGPVPAAGSGSGAGTSKTQTLAVGERSVTVHRSENFDVTHESFNMKDAVVGRNRYLRQALSLAFDVDAWIGVFMPSQALPARSPVPSGLIGREALLGNNPYRSYNIFRARELLAKAGYPEGRGLEPIIYLSSTDPTQRKMAEFLAKSFEVLGVSLKVTELGWPEFQSAIKEGKGQMWAYAWHADYPDAENFLQLFYSKNASPGPNDANYSNAEFDRLYEQALLLPDSQKRAVLYQRMVKIVLEDCPWILGVHRLSFTATQPWLMNFKPHLFDRGMGKYLRRRSAAHDADPSKTR